MKIFVTGLHRAGTHSLAEYLANKQSLPYIEEGYIKWDSLDRALKCIERYPDGFVLQCPGLSHKLLTLKEHGKVYWADRDTMAIVTSMKNSGIDGMAWHIMRNYKDEFPDDPIWDRLSYDGQDDAPLRYVGYYALLVSVKRYFYTKYFSKHSELVNIESQPYYNQSKTLTVKHPLKPGQMRKVNESLLLYQNSRTS